MTGSIYEVRLTQDAEADLETIHSYFTVIDSGVDADKLLDRLAEKVATLERFPLRGNVPKELEAVGIRKYRQILLPPYRLIYRVKKDTVLVVLIADGRRDMQALLEARLLRS